MSDPAKKRLGLVLPAGGARAAYQVGVLRYAAERFPEFQPRVFTGISAGSINASFLAQGEPLEATTKRLFDLWAKLEFEQVYRTNFRSIFRMLGHWVYDLFLSKVTRKLLLKSLLDASPLAMTLLGQLPFWKVSRAIRAGLVDGLAVSVTNYHDGNTLVFYDSFANIQPWRRERRRSVRAPIRVRHIMASCSIPMLFQPVRLGEWFCGDGSLRFSYPLSPAIKLGATHLFCIGTRSVQPEVAVNTGPLKRVEAVGLGFVAGAVLNSIFLDSLESDFENLQRINDAAPKRRIPSILLRPSEDLGALAVPHLKDMPFHMRQLLSSTAAPDELGDLLSYLMFSPSYLREVLELGRRDAEKQQDAIAKFLAEPSAVT